MIREDELEDEQEFAAQYRDTKTICVYRTLKDTARKQSWIGYQELNQTCGLGYDLGTDYGQHLYGEHVGAVNDFEITKQRPMLSAVLVHKQRPREPGRGFYTAADGYGLRQYGESNQQLWIRILKDCHAYWSKHP